MDKEMAFYQIWLEIQRRKAKAQELLNNDETYDQGKRELRAMERFEGELLAMETWLTEAL